MFLDEKLGREYPIRNVTQISLSHGYREDLAQLMFSVVYFCSEKKEKSNKNLNSIYGMSACADGHVHYLHMVQV